MKILALLSLLALFLVQEGVCTHLETCDCNEIEELVNATVQQAAAKLEHELSLMIKTAVSNINMSLTVTDLTSTIETLLKPIQRQLDYHLPLPEIKNSESNPATSCKDLYKHFPHAPSGFYWIEKSGSPVRVYCNMTLTCGDLTGGWMRVADIDMTNTSQQCPSGLSLLSSSGKRLCDITGTSNRYSSSYFTVHQVQYSHVCGRVIGYQNRFSAAFHFHDRNIEESYVFGVSLTYGQNPRKHIWTFAGASDETTSDQSYKCPCINTNISPPPVSSFVGNDYYCDTVLSVHFNTVPKTLQTSDPLWDGKGCGPTNSCCHDPRRSVNPPWFAKDLSSPTSDNIEMRLCRPDGSIRSTPVETVELYVQ